MNSHITNAVKENASTLLFNLLKSIPGKKDLVVDDDLITTLDYITKVQQLKACDVGRIFKLDAKNPPKDSDKAVYLVRASIANTNTIAEHVKTSNNLKLGVEFWIIFVPRKLFVCERVLEREGVHSFVKILEFPLCMFPIDSDLLSLELMDFYPAVFLNNDQTYLHTVAMSLVQFQNLFGIIPTVCGQGNCVEKVIDLLKIMMGEKKVSKERSLITHLILFDRDVDYVSTLLTQMSYEGLLDETYDIKGGRISFGREVTGQDKDIKIVLNDDDVIYKEIRNCHFSSVLGKLKETAKQLMSKAGSAVDHTTSMTIKDMKEIIAQKVKTAPQEKLLPLYINTCEVIIQEKNKWNFQEHLTTEQNLISGFKVRECINFIEETINRQASIFTSLRLFCLLSTTQDGVSSKDYKSLYNQFLQSYGHKHMLTLHHLKKLGLLIELTPFYRTMPSSVSSSGGAGKLAEKVVSAVASIPKQKSFRTITKKMTLVPNNNTDVDMKSPTDMSYVFSGAYTPIVGKLTEHVALHDSFGKSDEALKLLPGKSIYFAASSFNEGSVSSNNAKTILVYFLGGATYAEIGALRLLAKLKGFELIIATTSIINGNSLMKLLIPLTNS